MKAKRNFKKAVLVGAVFLFSITLFSSRAFAQRELMMPLGGVTGSYYMTGAPVAKYINEHSSKIRVTPSTSGGGVENLRRVSAGGAQIGMATAMEMYKSWHGNEPFKDKMRNWMTIGVSTKVLLDHVVTLAEYNVKTVEDLKGKIFAIGAPGSAAAASMAEFLEFTGLDKEITMRKLPHGQYGPMLLDRKIHAFNRLGSIPAAVVEEVAAQAKIVMVDFEPLITNSGFMEKFPYYQKVLVKVGTYRGIDRDVTIFGMAGYFICLPDLPEDIVYEFTRLAYSNECIKQVTMAFKGHNLNRETPLVGNIGPVHPGAAKFWKEIGLTIPEPVLK